MKKLIMLKGLPASGKSTYARKLVDEGFKRVNKDDLRSMIDNSVRSKSNEKMIIEARDFIIENSLSHGKSVVVDDTNFAPHHETNLRIIAKKYKAEFSVKFIDTPLDKCIARDAKREKSVGKRVITQMYYQNLAPTPIINESKGNTVIFDIDGTLAHMNGRSPFDYTKVSEDLIDPHVKTMLCLLSNNGYNITICTGRDGVCEKDTKQRLLDNHIQYDCFYMRGEGDHRKDFVVKKEMLDDIGRENVYCVFDDRPQVIRMRKEEGLKVFNVGTGEDF